MQRRTPPTVLLALLLSIVPAFAGDSTELRPHDTTEFAGHHYLLVDDVEELSWTAAMKQCKEWGGHLAVVSSREEAEFIATLCAGRYMFLGASDEAEEGVWSWVDGTPWKFTHWLAGQPNDYSGRENYLATYDDGEWVDVDHEGDDFWMPTGFVCEWDSPK